MASKLRLLRISLNQPSHILRRGQMPEELPFLPGWRTPVFME